MPNAAKDDMAAKLAGMSRTQLIRTLRGLRCPFKLDFTDEYLRSLSLERLRHIVLAACLHAGRDALCSA